jgi:hypothetical protein
MVIHTSLGFAQDTDAGLDVRTGGVITSMTDNENFKDPAVPLTALQEALNQFRASVAAMAQGGKQATAQKNDMREQLIALLRQQALYVQSASANELPVLLSSGFDAAGTNRAQSPLDKPTIVKIENKVSTQLQLRVTTVINARSYEAQTKTPSGDWQAAGIHTKARTMILEDLTPGTLYTIQVRAIGGSTGYSDWSDPVSHMAL